MDTCEEAADWFNRLRNREIPEADLSRFSEWLEESPVHIREYLAVAEVWGALQSPEAWPDQSSEELIRILRQARDANIIPLRDSGENSASLGLAGDAKMTRPSHLRLFRYAVAAGVALFSLTFMWPRLTLNSTAYMTERGEQRSVVLSDGSVVQLNTLSKLIVHFDARRRSVELPRGEAFFRVAHDSERPFEVETPFATVRAVGTEFNVYNNKESTRVAVLEGKVRVESSPSPTSGRGSRQTARGATIDLTPQQSANVSAQGEIGMLPAQQAATAIAWIQRRIVLDDVRADAAVEQFNRYNQIQMKIRDPQLATLRITGVFNADDPNALLQYLQQVQGVKVHKESNELILQRGE